MKMSSRKMLGPATRRWCGICKWFLAVGMVVIFVMVIYTNIPETAVGAYWEVLQPEIQAVTQPTPLKMFLIHAVIILGLAAQFAIGLAMFRLFHVFQYEDVFGDKVLKTLRFLGLTIFISAIWSLIQPTLVPLLMTLDNPPGARTVSVALSSNTLILMITGAMVMIVGQVMMVGAEAVDENRQFV